MEQPIQTMVDQPGEPWTKITPPYCQWVELQNLPTPIIVKLENGEADIRVDGQMQTMVPHHEQTYHGLVEVHNTRASREPGDETEIWYRQLV